MTQENEYELKLKQFITNNKIEAKHLAFEQSCHSVAEAAQAANCATEDFVKNICMVDANNNLIVAIVKGEDRASTSAVGKYLNIDRPRTATPDEILEKTGYPCGGTPSFGFQAKFIIDPKVLEKSVVYTGGGSEKSLVCISAEELQKANQGQVAKISK
jgi:Cys-tRNA(Pro)/Cys-tRNA(Cys) deacylase